MGRHRMIKDSIWGDPKLSNLTTENYLTLVLLLTNSYSNVIGVYRAQWRSLGAGIGWTEAQLLSAARDLEAKGLIAIDVDTGWIWVKPWWDHNSISGAFKGKASTKARSELNQVPEQWRTAVQTWLASHDEDGDLKFVVSTSVGPSDGHTWGYLAPSPNHTPNHTSTGNHISTTTGNADPSIGGGGDEPDLNALVNAAVWAAAKTSGIHNEAGYRAAIKTRIQQNGPSSEDLLTLKAWRADLRRIEEQRMEHQRLARQAEDDAEARSARLRENERIIAAFDTLAPAERDKALDRFQASCNPMVLSSLKKQGLKSPLVQAALTEYLRTAPTPSPEATTI